MNLLIEAFQRTENQRRLLNDAKDARIESLERYVAELRAEKEELSRDLALAEVRIEELKK